MGSEAGAHTGPASQAMLLRVRKEPCFAERCVPLNAAPCNLHCLYFGREYRIGGKRFCDGATGKVALQTGSCLSTW